MSDNRFKLKQLNGELPNKVLTTDANGNVVATVPIDTPPVNIAFTATGTDNYIGSTTGPNILAYDTAVIYIGIFANDNTAPSTFNIDGLPTYDIVKGTDLGLVPLDPLDIQATVTYFLIWDTAQFIIFDTFPDFAPQTYTNLSPVPQALGGVLAGTTFNATPIKGVFDMLLYPYLAAQFSSFLLSAQANPLEVGATLSNITRTFTWGTTNSGTVAVNTIKVKDVTANVVLFQNSQNDGTQTLSLPSPITKVIATSHTWQITAKRTNNSTLYKNLVVNWRWRMFYGTSALTILTEPQIEALAGQTLASTSLGTFTYVTGGYKYFVVPNQFVNPILFRDQSTNLAVGMAGTAEGYTDSNGGAYKFLYISITNGFGILNTYRVYRTKNILGGSIQIIVT